jgi:hypothetical protein
MPSSKLTQRLEVGKVAKSRNLRWEKIGEAKSRNGRQIQCRIWFLRAACTDNSVIKRDNRPSSEIIFSMDLKQSASLFHAKCMTGQTLNSRPFMLKVKIIIFNTARDEAISRGSGIE